MEPRIFEIKAPERAIPAALWGPPSDRVILAVHGAQSSKTDPVFRLPAELGGCQLLSFDLPGLGEQQPWTTFACLRDLTAVMDWAEHRWDSVGLFAVSLGAWFSLRALGERKLDHAWLLSPVVDMERLTLDMMTWFQVSEARLEHEGAVPTPMGQTLDWAELCDARAHPIRRWPVSTDILRGGKDTLCGAESVSAFAERFHCRLTVVPGAEHWFHTPSDLAALERWLTETNFPR